MSEQDLSSHTIAELQWAGFTDIGLVCWRCNHAAVIQMVEFRRRRSSTLAALNECAYCSRCEQREGIRHYDVMLQPLREGNPWP